MIGRRGLWRYGFGAALAMAVPVNIGFGRSARAEVESDPAFRVVDAWDVTPQTFPGEALLSAQRPALTQAPNGDLLIVFNTSGDADPGGQLRLISSTDHGRTWGASEVVAEPRLFGERGSIVCTRGMATLRDGRILLPYNDAVNHANYNNRESVLFVAASVDSGRSWTGTDQAVVLPEPIREAHLGGGRIVELGNGTLLLPIWGAKDLVDGWQTDPMRWRSGVLRSFDGGQTWSDYRTIAYDPNNPPQYPPYNNYNYPSGASEIALNALPDGRIMAVIRFAAGIGPNRGQVYLSYSDDDGATWSLPAATAQQAEALSLATAPCTDNLASGESKVVMGHRHLDTSGRRTGRTAVRSSFDGGVTWVGETFLRDPGGATNLGPVTGEPDFHRLPGNRMLVVFQVFPPGKPSKIVANIIQDAVDPVHCRAQAADAAQRVTATPTVFLERIDRAEWAWPFASRKVTHSASTTVADVVRLNAGALSFRVDDSLILMDSSGQVLDPLATLAEAGVVNGDVLRLRGTAPAQPWRIGFSELDRFPESRHVYGWDRAGATGPFALDYRERALGLELDIPSGHEVSAIEIRARNATSRLVAADYRILISSDNDTYADVSGWALSSRVENGRLIHRFAGLSVTEGYLKIHQRYTDVSYTFVIDDPRTDVSVEFTK